MKKIIVASNNLGKLREFESLLAPFAFEAVPQAALGIAEADEPFATFLENALAKARHASRLGGLPALADDSGICVPALNGAPGVRSARYASEEGKPKSDAANNEKLVCALADKADKRAFYYCVLVFVTHPDDPHPLVCDGECWGEIVTQARGDGGFGYDPHFWLPALGKTAAELDAATKNRIGHRGQAMQALTIKLQSQRAFLA